MNKKMTGILIDLLITGVVFSVFFFEDNDYVYYYAVFLFCTSSFGLLCAIFGSIKEISKNGFKWGYYLTTSLQAAILFNTKFWFIGCIFLLVALIVLMKNVLGMRIYKDDVIYLQKRS